MDNEEYLSDLLLIELDNEINDSEREYYKKALEIYHSTDDFDEYYNKIWELYKNTNWVFDSGAFKYASPEHFIKKFKYLVFETDYINFTSKKYIVILDTSEIIDFKPTNCFLNFGGCERIIVNLNNMLRDVSYEPPIYIDSNINEKLDLTFPIFLFNDKKEALFKFNALFCKMRGYSGFGDYSHLDDLICLNLLE